MEARRFLREAGAAGTDLSAGMLYSLHLESTGDREAAEQIARAKLWAELKSGQTPDGV